MGLQGVKAVTIEERDATDHKNNCQEGTIQYARAVKQYMPELYTSFYIINFKNVKTFFACATASVWRSEDHVDPRDGKVIRLGSKHIYLMNFANPYSLYWGMS